VIEVESKKSGAIFPADAVYARRMAELAERVGAAVEQEVLAIVTRPAGMLDGSTVPADEAAALVGRYELGSSTELALLALPVARLLANPPISGYRVAAVGIEAEGGDLVLGGNLEFPGTELSTTIHAEGFVSLRARRRGRTLANLAVPEAHPCAQCRQTLSESMAADGLTIVDPLGHRLSIADLYPWAFRPAALGVPGDTPARVAWPNLAFVAEASETAPADVAALLLECGSHAHAPYSGAPSAVVFRAHHGPVLGAGCVESVAFNPSVSALQAVLVELAARHGEPSRIAEAWLARTEGGVIDPEPGFRALLRAVAPSATAHVVDWRTGG
jgi:cytidine deaminase